MPVTNAIPTVYKSIRFRSRLEARWAAFFDLCSWPWEYEPLDLVGYIPDFVLPFARPLLAEVKPLLALNDPTWESAQGKIERSGWDGEALILGASLFVGGGGENFADDVQIGMLAERCVFDTDGSLAPLPGAERFTNPTRGERYRPSEDCAYVEAAQAATAGWKRPATVYGTPAVAFGAVTPPAYGWSWNPAPLERCECCGRLSFFNNLMTWRCRVSDCYSGDHFVAMVEPREAKKLWAEAGNAVQWRGAPGDERAAALARLGRPFGTK